MMWLTDQNEALSMFLTYGQDIFPEELECKSDVYEDGKLLITPTPPKLIDFQTKVCRNNV